MATVSPRRRVTGRLVGGILMTPLWAFGAYFVAKDSSFPRSSMYIAGAFAVVSALVALGAIYELRTMPRE